MNDDEPQPIECRAAVEISPTATNEILFLPIGLHAITPVAGGIGRPIKVKVGPESAQSIEAQRTKLMASGKRPYFDFNHEDGPASFWPESFSWKSGEGVVARGEWSRRGKSAVEGKDYRAFSPVFHVDNKRADNGATVICRENASPNMGGLVNDPAFRNLPLWAKNAEQLGTPESGDNAEAKRKKMNEEELAALRAKQQELQTEVDALKAQNKPADQSETALENIQLKIEAAELRSRSALLSDQIQAKNKVEADLAITEAIKCGAILPKDRTTQDRWRTQLVADPATFMPLLKDAIKAAKSHNVMDTRITSRTITVQEEDPGMIFGAMARITANSKKSRKPDEKLACAREFAALYASECSVKASNRDRILAFPMDRLEDALIASDVTDSDLGTLSGTLVVQRTLELLRFEFPSLGMFTTDFTSEQASFNQTIMTRTVGIPPVVDYNTSTGWATGIDAPVTTDVPITIDKHQGVPIAFNEQIMASTVRRLFDEQAPAQAYALAKAMVDDLYSNITDANFTNNTVIATASFTRAIVNAVSTALTLRGVPLMLGNRTMLLYPTVFQKLMDDTVLMQLAAFQKPTLITDPTSGGVSLVLPVSNFQVVNAPNLPTNDGNVTGFAGSKSALCIASRLPNDYTKFAPGVSYGNVQTVTDPDLGLSVMLTQYVDHTLATGNQRLTLMYGTNAGQGAAGQLIKAATGSGSSRTS
jgi:phage I-like protein